MTLIWKMHLWYGKKVSVSVTKILVPEKGIGICTENIWYQKKSYRYRKYFVLEKVSVSAKIDTRKKVSVLIPFKILSTIRQAT